MFTEWIKIYLKRMNQHLQVAYSTSNTIHILSWKIFPSLLPEKKKEKKAAHASNNLKPKYIIKFVLWMLYSAVRWLICYLSIQNTWSQVNYVNLHAKTCFEHQSKGSKCLGICVWGITDLLLKTFKTLEVQILYFQIIFFTANYSKYYNTSCIYLRWNFSATVLNELIY